MTQISEKLKQKLQISALFPNELKSLLKQISRFSISLVLVILLGIAIATPASAAPETPMFNPEKVRLGITPTGWSNSDDLTIDTNPPISYQQILSEIALSGFKGTQNAPKFPKDIDDLKAELELREITISEPWVGTYFTIGDAEDSKKIFKDQMEFMKEIGDSNIIVVAELGGAVHQQPVAPLPNRPKLTDEQWEQLTEGLNELGKEAYDEGMVLCYHPHIGTGVEDLADIDRLMEGTNPKYLKLLLDTGHLYYAGVDPLEVTKKYADRIKHVHLKNIRKPILQQSREKGWSFLYSIRKGIFTVPGDDKDGIIDFEPIFKELAKVNYEGWLIVEAEQDPNTILPPATKPVPPLEYAFMARNYLHEVTGL
ncbi:MAG: myo-inosose-2 dehydratase [Xenococcaceae cyanobacterium MO_167.B27]|nr:myo-inosose-2 dehydratase [Xenococcaceae cyanobacterium MO_167.B27]